jgi:hypothetical protein
VALQSIFCTIRVLFYLTFYSDDVEAISQVERDTATKAAEDDELGIIKTPLAFKQVQQK